MYVHPSHQGSATKTKNLSILKCNAYLLRELLSPVIHPGELKLWWPIMKTTRRGWLLTIHRLSIVLPSWMRILYPKSMKPSMPLPSTEFLVPLTYAVLTTRSVLKSLHCFPGWGCIVPVYTYTFWGNKLSSMFPENHD